MEGWLPTAFTHAAVGAALGQFVPRGFDTKRLVIFLAVLSALPDLDVIAFHFGIPYSAPVGHRGFSHSITFAVILSVGMTLIFLSMYRNRRRACLGIGLITFVAVASHGFLDAATDAGLGIGFFIPFDNHRYFLPFRPIETSAVDPRVFFSHPARALSILSNEFLWVWTPLLSLTVLYQGLSRVFRLRRLK